MKIIVPMAGRGSRLRPHTLTVPKPLIPIAGKPIVQRLVEDIAKVVDEPIEEVAFVIGKDFGEAVEEQLKNIATGLKAKASIYIQDQPLGTGHAIMSAEPSLSGPAVVAYADTLFKADFTIEDNTEAMIWVKQVDNPKAFGVVNLNDKGHITDLVEKPEHPESDLAVIGIYYFKDVGILKEQLQRVLDENIIRGGEYQINDGIEKMKANGIIFKPGKVDEWMDCGNKTVTVETNKRTLEHLKNSEEKLISDQVEIHNSEITEPCFIADDVKLINAKIGPHVSLGKGTVVKDSTIKNSLIQEQAEIKNANLDNAMIGNFVKFDGNFTSISIGDYSVLE
ncbi:sugar phosphate nucleotidyltransferase [Mesohalobacter halotolerans]|uniref:Nucleotidyltransferase n=1 Tax=Mesohalobacter halotolerans TaxID=1883405 RepID=A0A4U5TT03_9FLAO|nr:sugar phosphate nucleotidyltransferase [Mesohalobacter halotolerans]MBS3738354.1 NTP transferase domain-containing protein [Psychroflexus sp.]TKS57253.1 nucleotidyltransferase [Mesohalobacter halotolerans]